MIELEGKRGNNTTKVFITFPDSGERPKAQENRYAWKYAVENREDDDYKKSGIVIYESDEKVRGGGAFPVAWRKRGFLELPDGIEFPLDKEHKKELIDYILKEEFTNVEVQRKLGLNT